MLAEVKREHPHTAVGLHVHVSARSSEKADCAPNHQAISPVPPHPFKETDWMLPTHSRCRKHVPCEATESPVAAPAQCRTQDSQILSPAPQLLCWVLDLFNSPSLDSLPLCRGEPHAVPGHSEPDQNRKEVFPSRTHSSSVYSQAEEAGSATVLCNSPEEETGMAGRKSRGKCEDRKRQTGSAVGEER